MALKGALRSYAVARDLITLELEPLVISHLSSIKDSIAEAFGVTNKVEYEREVFANVVRNMQQIVDELSLAGYSDISK